MSWTVILSGRARRSLKRVPVVDQKRIMAALAGMQADPLSGDVVKLTGQDALRRRIGAYRIIFRIGFKVRTVAIVGIERRTTTTYR
jgi:mRNA-degrading endonuclease RelE of RelBE toxin-antitoxin system